MDMRTSLDLSSERPLVGLLTKMPCPAAVEIAGHCNADLVVIDLEHGANSGVELEHHIRAADSAGIPVLVRVPANDKPSIQAALDSGANGVVVPHISSAADARRATAAAFYPPSGERGLALSTRAGRQGTTTLASALEHAKQNTVVICQIEDPLGVAAAHDIVAVDGVAGVWIGVNDLSMSMRDAAGCVDSAAVDAAVASVCSTVTDSPKALVALAPTPAAMKTWRARGVRVMLATLHDLLNGSLRQYIDDAISIDQSPPSRKTADLPS